MAHIYVAQLAHLTQELIEYVTNANNLIMRSKYELDRIQKTTKMLCTVQEELEKDIGYGQQLK